MRNQCPAGGGLNSAITAGLVDDEAAGGFVNGLGAGGLDVSIPRIPQHATSVAVR
jgi:hypothetical protein